jgi:hypothetical protein
MERENDGDERVKQRESESELGECMFRMFCVPPREPLELLWVPVVCCTCTFFLCASSLDLSSLPKKNTSLHTKQEFLVLKSGFTHKKQSHSGAELECNNATASKLKQSREKCRLPGQVIFDWRRFVDFCHIIFT